MLADRRRDEKKEQPGRGIIGSAERNTFIMPPEHNCRLIHEPHESITSVGYRHAIAKIGGLKLLPLLQSAEQRSPGCGAASNYPDLRHQLGKGLVAFAPGQIQVDGLGTEQFTQRGAAGRGRMHRRQIGLGTWELSEKDFNKLAWKEKGLGNSQALFCIEKIPIKAVRDW